MVSSSQVGTHELTWIFNTGPKTIKRTRKAFVSRKKGCLRKRNRGVMKVNKKNKVTLKENETCTQLNEVNPPWILFVNTLL